VRRGTRAVIVTVATLAPAIAVWLAIGWANPPHHDLSDAATGLMQLLFAGLAALAGLAISAAATRRRGPE
jgi:hypothetical protein